MGEVTFGDVRAAMALEPSRAWSELYVLASGYHDAREWREVVVPYLLGHDTIRFFEALMTRVKPQWRRIVFSGGT